MPACRPNSPNQPQNRKIAQCKLNEGKSLDKSSSCGAKFEDRDQKMAQTFSSGPKHCPKTCPKHRSNVNRESFPREIPNFRLNQPNFSVKPFQNERIRQKSPRNQRKPSNSPSHQQINRFHSMECSNAHCGKVQDICEDYKRLECKDTIWTIKIMKDSANTAKVDDSPALVQTSLTTIVNAEKLESLLPSEDRFIDEDPQLTQYSPGEERFMQCTACYEALKRQKAPQPVQKSSYRPKNDQFQPQKVTTREFPLEDSKMSENQGREVKTVQREPFRPRSESKSPKSGCFCCRKKNKRKKTKEKSNLRPDYYNNCSENYIC